MPGIVIQWKVAVNQKVFAVRVASTCSEQIRHGPRVQKTTLAVVDGSLRLPSLCFLIESVKRRRRLVDLRW